MDNGLLAAADSAGKGTVVALLVFIALSVWLGTLAQRVVEKGSFLKGYFLGNRGLGSWALALTATVQSGGTFMGFPSMVYSYGWIVALWIGAYMMVPLTGFGVLGKRIAQISRHTGAITVPDLFRARFASPSVGLMASLLILFFMSFMMVAQFKAGALIMKVSWPGSGALALVEDFDSLDRYYYWGLAIFALTVVGYTLIGGFLAAVWTDLFQSVMMLIGIMILLPLTLQAAGGLEKASRKLQGERAFRQASDAQLVEAPPIASEKEFQQLDAALRRYAADHEGQAPATLAELPESSSTPAWSKLVYIGQGARIVEPGAADRVMVSLTPGDPKVPRTALYSNGLIRTGLFSNPGDLSTGPGPFNFHPLTMAISFFFTWVFAGLGSPAGIVRIMACKDTPTIRRSIFLLATYNMMIYLPLIVICICGWSIIPDLRQTDEIIPRLALSTTGHLPAGSFIAGLILAAPFGAVMATVSSYLVVIASGLVRDVYQRFVNPNASENKIRWLSYFFMILVGAVAVAANIKPAAYLQAIVVFSGTCGAATFVTPALMAAYWRRATAAGAMASMMAGVGSVLTLYSLGWIKGEFKPYLLYGFDPIVWGLAASLFAGVAVSLITRPPGDDVVLPLFDAA